VAPLKSELSGPQYTVHFLIVLLLLEHYFWLSQLPHWRGFKIAVELEPVG
jgi:hypothetical protein